MGKLNGEILLAEKKVRELRKQLRRDEKIPRRTKGKIELVFKMALRYIRWTQRFGRLYGKYEECYPALASGICETFYADDTELAACFRVSPAMIELWQQVYPDFKNQIRAGRSRFTRWNGSDVYRQRWFRLLYAKVAKNICEVFKPTKRQLKRCFCNIEIEAGTWKELNHWFGEYCYQTVYSHLGYIRKRLGAETIERICSEFNPDGEQLAQCLGWSVKDAEEFLSDWKLRREKEKQMAEGLWRSLSESRKVETDNGAGHGEEREKQE